MKPRKRTITQTILLLAFIVLMLSTFTDSVPLAVIPNEQGSPTDECSLVIEEPQNQYSPAAPTWNYEGCWSLYSRTSGTISNIASLPSDDGNMAVFTEEFVVSDYRFEAVFLTSNVYAQNYEHIELRMEFSQDWSLAAENLMFSVSLCNAAGQPQSWHYVNQLLATAGSAFDISSMIRDLSITTARKVAVKVQGAIETVDWGQQNTWRFDYLGIAFLNHYPRITDVSCDADESYTLYPHYGSSPTNNYMLLSITGLCYDGGSEIQSGGFQYVDEQGSLDGAWTCFWISSSFVMMYTGAADSTWASLVPAACSISTTSTTRTITFGVLIEWGHPTDTHGFPDVGGISQVASSEVTSLLFTSPFRVESRLSMQTSPAISESKVNAGSTCSYTGDVQYYNSPSHIAPRASEVDIQVRRTTPSATGWIYTAQPATDGTFTVQPSTVSTAGTNTFELRVVADGATTNLLTSTYSDTVIGDRAVYSSGSIGSINYNPNYGGGVRNTGQSDTLYLKLQWESSGTPITSGTVSWASSGDTVSMAYNSGQSRWEGLTYSRSTTGMLTYNDLIVNIDGVTSVSVEPIYKVVWDEIEILTTTIEGGDDYVNIGNSINIRVTAKLSFLDIPLDPGADSLYMNGLKMSNGGTYFTYTVFHTYPGLWTYSVDDASALETTYGITKIATGKPSISCTWDTFSVDLSVDDAHVSMGDTVRVWAHVTRAYDGSVFTDGMGSIVLRHTTSGDISMTYSSGAEMWYADVTQNSVNQWTYFIYSISDTVEQISTVGRGMNFDGVDGYVGCGADSSLDLTSRRKRR